MNHLNSIMKTPFIKLGLITAVLVAGAFRATALDGVVIANNSVSATSLSAAAKLRALSALELSCTAATRIGAFYGAFSAPRRGEGKPD